VEIVRRVEELTADWFSATMRRGPVDGVRLVPLTLGAMCQMVRAELSWGSSDGLGPASVIVKLSAQDPGTRGLALAMGMYELETRFYEELLPVLGDVSIPRCHGAALDSDTGDFTLVLEDLSGQTRAGDVLMESSPLDCALVLAELAKLQAASWNSTAMMSMPWLAAVERTQRIFDSMPSGLAPFLDRFGHALAQDHIDLFERVIPKAGQWIRSWSGPTVLQHGDLRTDNVLFAVDTDTPRATIVDFQTVRLGPPGIDAAYFLGSSLSTETRRSLERRLLREHHDRLVAAGVEDYDFDDCWDGYRQGAIYAVYLFCGLSAQVAPSERVDRVIADQTRRYADMALDLEAPQLAGLI
jgi:aminoglycoside phosphotransferase (APT) family kinase protein